MSVQAVSIPRVPSAVPVVLLVVVALCLSLGCQATTAAPPHPEPPLAAEGRAPDGEAPPLSPEEDPVTASDAVAPGSVDCSLPPESGPCRAAFKRFYFDSVSGTCKPFTYGGCQGNTNRFESSEACQNACTGR